MDRRQIQELIFSLRSELGDTQERFGARYGVSQQSVDNWESGAYLPSRTVAKRLCLDLGIKPEEIDRLRPRRRKKATVSTVGAGLTPGQVEIFTKLKRYWSPALAEQLQSIVDRLDKAFSSAPTVP